MTNTAEHSPDPPQANALRRPQRELPHAVTRRFPRRAWCIARRGLTPPRALLVSAARAPHTPVRRRVSDLDDAGLLGWLDGFGGFPPELTRYPAYLRYALRTVRRDLALTSPRRTWTTSPRPRATPS
ncbi:hypothetical protein ACF08M_32935 [Streptomyces sp. NPDC015032]|uniref:hypothetical protein n=1 Tax=Streptomyces sp. NPDC015032 TaxID=3364937 RepID=UPI0036FF2297